MAIVNPYISIIILNINEITHQSKQSAGWIKKKKTQPNSAYKRLISTLMTHIGSKVK